MQFFSLGFLTFKNLQFSITIKAWVVQKERAEFYFNIFSSLLVRKFALKQWPRASVILWVNKRQIEKRYNTPQKIHKLPIRRKKTFLFLVKRKRGIYSLSYWTIFNYYHSYEQTTFLSVLFWFGLVWFSISQTIIFSAWRNSLKFRLWLLGKNILLYCDGTACRMNVKTRNQSVVSSNFGVLSET